ncbi:hypothetical protein H2200_007032 [Cladophialophora chaetospira]|uniref:Uncharacterized protein n=1 Tax=Cladophialophora chaetospira TaxID=386627 RepID=A0AA38X784_9EURO|nr:hypothetical protein H2200_007032 [Cladophialophora chaetospira]
MPKSKFPDNASTFKFYQLATSANAWFVQDGDEMRYESAPITVNGNTLAELVRVKRVAGSTEPERDGESFFWEVLDNGAWVDLGWANAPAGVEQELLSLYRGRPGVVIAGEPSRQGAGAWSRFLFFGPRTGPGRNTMEDVRHEFGRTHPNNRHRQPY